MIELLADFVVALVALAHIGFLVLEMFLWEKPLGLKVFRQTAERAAMTRTLAANQGLYNGFLAAGLIWGLIPDVNANEIKAFFLGCVVIAGIYGAVTVSRRIFVVQAAPALVGLVLVLLGSSTTLNSPGAARTGATVCMTGSACGASTLPGFSPTARS